ncbi:Chitinase 4 [Basidiobolus ranarum]|uniref:Chitinase 4 n=1 Tax=Basidiobolus ranarum TaxID=34480 RepID=A0ABR2VXL2_9FUNG
MNCADIEIIGPSDGYITGPNLLMVNLPGYTTIPEFPQDGPNDGRDLLAARLTITIRPGRDNSPTTTTTATTTTIPTLTTTSPSTTSTTRTSTPTPTSSISKTTSPTSTAGAGACNGVAAWNAGVAYFESSKSTYNGHLWKARWWTQNETPGSNSAWVDLGAC